MAHGNAHEMESDADRRLCTFLIGTLREAGVDIAEDADQATVRRCLESELHRRQRSRPREAAELRRLVSQLRLQLSLVTASMTASDRSDGTQRQEAHRQAREAVMAIAATEDAIVDQVQEEFIGVGIFFSPVRAARPHGQALLEFVEELLERDARGDFPRPEFLGSGRA
jgi:hypothetical protein